MENRMAPAELWIVYLIGDTHMFAKIAPENPLV